MNLELKMRTNCFRKYMSLLPSSKGISDAKLRKLAGWTSFNAGWDACLDSMAKMALIKSEPLSKRTMSG